MKSKAHQDTSLLFQFILSDWIIVYEAFDQGDLKKLVDNSPDYLRLFSWGCEEGVLTKLKNNCAYFSKSGAISGNAPNLLHHHIDQAWLHTLEDEIKKAFSHIKQSAKIFQRILPFFKDDENVLYFIYRHQKRLDAIFKESFVQKLFIEFDAINTIIQKYKARGFDKIIHE